MRIISKFKDYYDCGMSWGQDPSLIYLRVPKNEKPLFHVPNQSGFRSYAIGFCGKIYPCLGMFCEEEVEEFIFGNLVKRKVFKEHFCYNIDDVDHFVSKNYGAKETDFYYDQKSKKKRFKYTAYSLYSRDPISRRDACLEIFDFFEKRKEKFSAYFLDKKTPIFVQYPDVKWNEHSYITVNEQLSKFNFVKVFDPVRAYQEISMFVGGMASPEKEIPDISDQDLLEAKGFDNWSFRKMSSKKN